MVSDLSFLIGIKLTLNSLFNFNFILLQHFIQIGPVFIVIVTVLSVQQGLRELVYLTCC